jgi:hypothetical protein
MVLHRPVELAGILGMWESTASQGLVSSFLNLFGIETGTIIIQQRLNRNGAPSLEV